MAAHGVLEWPFGYHETLFQGLLYNFEYTVLFFLLPNSHLCKSINIYSLLNISSITLLEQCSIKNFPCAFRIVEILWFGRRGRRVGRSEE